MITASCHYGLAYMGARGLWWWWWFCVGLHRQPSFLMSLLLKFDRSDFYEPCSCLLLTRGNLDIRATEEELWKSRNWVGSQDRIVYTYSSSQKQGWVPWESEHGLKTFVVFCYLGVKNNRLKLFHFINDAKRHWPELDGI